MRWSGGGYNEVKSIQLSATKSMDHRRQWSKGIVAVFGFAAFQDDGAAWNGMEWDGRVGRLRKSLFYCHQESCWLTNQCTAVSCQISDGGAAFGVGEKLLCNCGNCGNCGNADTGRGGGLSLSHAVQWPVR